MTNPSNTETLRGQTKEEAIKERLKGRRIHIVFRTTTGDITNVAIVGTSRQITNPLLEVPKGTIEEVAEHVRDILKDISPESATKPIHFYKGRENFLNRDPVFTLDPQNNSQK